MAPVFSGIDPTAWELIGDPIWVFDLDDYRVVWSNRFGIELWAADSLEELLARDLSDSSDIAKARLGEMADGFALGKTYETNWTLYPLKQPVEVRFRCSGVRADNGRMMMLVHVIEQFGKKTPQQKTVEGSEELVLLREQLAHAEARNRAFAEAGSDWLWETDKDHRFVCYSSKVNNYWTYEFDEVLGITRMELIEKVGADPKTKENETKWANHFALLERQESFRELEYAYDTGTGKIAYAAVSGNPIYDENGVFQGYRGVGRDITRRVEAESYAREMQRERDVAVTANSVTNQFLATMSHELRTPLNAIVGFSEVMMDELFGEMQNQKYLEYSTDIYDSSRHLLSIVEDLLNVSRLDITDENLSLEWMSAGEFTEEVVRMTRSLATGRELRLLTDLPDAQYAFQADRRALRQVLFNLISNAIKFTPVGGDVEVSCAKSAFGGTEIIVRDTGCGIEISAVEHIFEPFRTNNALIANSHGGAGLGLWISRRIVAAHGGEIDVESTLGQGTKVRVWLPEAARGEDDSLGEEASSHRQVSSGK